MLWQRLSHSLVVSFLASLGKVENRALEAELGEGNLHKGNYAYS